ncbi:MAG: orotidine-5'-phosphate decarboxylase [Promethearchaeota archaeon]|nr:MAG: orotidine-5'-phosphate decarboxylase [Candidatus Lokiarchaeota archaeon]
MFVEKLIELIKEKKSVVCMGLDPRMDNDGQIPKYLIDNFNKPNEIITEFNKSLIDNAYDLIPIIKPQIAFYEKYDALTALKETINYAHKKDLLVILDSKRNDIGSTSEAYAHSNFKVYGADACTVNAYFGIDGVQPFLDYIDKGVFILVKTSNPSSREFQNLFTAEMRGIPDTQIETTAKEIKLERNYIYMARLVNKWGKNLTDFSGYHNLGVVVGATYPDELKRIREILKNSFILIPGYGAQGAQAKDIKYGFKSEGLGGIVNSSRSIMFAYHNKNYPPEKFGKAAREEIIDMNKKINKEIGI